MLFLLNFADDVRRKTPPGGDHRHGRSGGVYLIFRFFALLWRRFHDPVRHQLAVQLERPEDAAQ